MIYPDMVDPTPKVPIQVGGEREERGRGREFKYGDEAVPLLMMMMWSILGVIMWRKLSKSPRHLTVHVARLIQTFSSSGNQSSSPSPQSPTL